VAGSDGQPDGRAAESAAISAVTRGIPVASKKI
jgi:hypothetical protein